MLKVRTIYNALQIARGRKKIVTNSTKFTSSFISTLTSPLYLQQSCGELLNFGTNCTPYLTVFHVRGQLRQYRLSLVSGFPLLPLTYAGNIWYQFATHLLVYFPWFSAAFGAFRDGRKSTKLAEALLERSVWWLFRRLHWGTGTNAKHFLARDIILQIRLHLIQRRNSIFVSEKLNYES